MNRNDRIIFSMAVFLLTLLVYVSFYDFSLKCTEVRNNSVRLHILANSDDKKDQELKLIVRDEILKDYGDIMASCKSREDALKKLRNIKGDIRDTALETLRENGSKSDVNVRLENMYFDKRDYKDNVTMPSGNYDALRIEIGKAEGKNWWCVMYPPLCIPVYCEKDAAVLESEIKSLREENLFKAKFAFVEFGQKLSQRLRFS